MPPLRFTPLCILVLLLPTLSPAARVAGIKVVDEQVLMIRVADTEVHFVEDLAAIRRRGKLFQNLDSASAEQDVLLRHDPPLETTSAATPTHWLVRSDADPAYGAAGRSPTAVHRRAKLTGLAVREWVEANRDFRYETGLEHWLFLRLPTPMVQGARYHIEADPSTGLDATRLAITFDAFESRTEAIHVNLAGYTTAPGIKAADLHLWLGDGGPRDYSTFEGRTVFLRDIATGQDHEAGSVRFWKKSGPDAGNWNYTASDVWTADFTGFNRPGTYRLAIPGVGCSEPFVIQDLPRKDPYDIAVQGYFFMRIGQPPVPGIAAVPRQPLYIEATDPAACRVYLTSMHPYHPQWQTFAPGDKWDPADSWIPFKLPGEPTNPNARGGHSDAADWDRHLAHVSDIYDALLPYILTGGILDDDDTGIAESGNGIPDSLDTARWGVDFFLSLKTPDGYGHGITCPGTGHALYQAAPTGVAAWANAANAAMLADALRIAGQQELMARYRDAALEAWSFASALADPMLDQVQDIGTMPTRGRDFRMMAAAFLYNVTGDRHFEDVVAAESVVRDSPDPDLCSDAWQQLYASAAYLSTHREVRHPQVLTNMRTAILREARQKEAGRTTTRPSRRAANEGSCWFQSAADCQRTILAHHAATSPTDQAFFRDALVLEADWGLGRNPANLIQMTTAGTPLEGKRSVQLCYTTGQLDGVPGLHPGHTPYMNVNDWWAGMLMSMPSRLATAGYPEWSKWPHAEGHFDTRHIYANSEFTPRQTMRGKFAIYAYLHALEKRDAATR